MDRLTVKKCVCHRRTFEELKVLADKNNFKTVEELMDAKLCSTSCGICRPYVEKMLKTGEIAFKPGGYR